MLTFLASSALASAFRGGLGAAAGKAVAHARADWSAIPPKAKLALLAVVALIAACFVHQHYAHKALKAANQAGYDRAKQEDAAELALLKQRAQTATKNGRQIAQEVRTKNDQVNRDIHASADDERMRGPGAASCRRVDHPALPAARGGYVAPGGPGDVAGGPLPADDGFAAVQWSWLVDSAEQADLERAEVLAWRDWYRREAAEWDKLKKTTPAAASKP
jgi:hypothetical protein